MTDVATKKPLHLQPTSGGPILYVSVPHLDVLRPFLDRNRVTYWLNEGAASYNGGPYIGVMMFGRKADAAKIQALLDGEP